MHSSPGHCGSPLPYIGPGLIVATTAFVVTAVFVVIGIFVVMSP
jgi:hypothetical protein